MTDENKMPGHPRVFITLLQEDGEQEGAELMQIRQVVIGSVTDRAVRNEVRWVFGDMLLNLVDERERLLADGTRHERREA